MDNAGNSADSTSVGVKLDKTAPTITNAGVQSGTAGTNSWYITVVTNRFTASDGLAGLDSSCATAFPKNVTSGTDEGSAVLIPSGSCSDNAGNTNSGISPSFKIDLSNPTVDSWTGSINDGDSFYFGSVPAAPTCTAADRRFWA